MGQLGPSRRISIRIKIKFVLGPVDSVDNHNCHETASRSLGWDDRHEFSRCKNTCGGRSPEMRPLWRKTSTRHQNAGLEKRSPRPHVHMPVRRPNVGLRTTVRPPTEAASFVYPHAGRLAFAFARAQRNGPSRGMLGPSHSGTMPGAWGKRPGTILM
jgi:hypothetical protein